MMRRSLLCMGLLCLCVASVQAQGGPGTAEAPATGFRAEYLGDLDGLRSKFLSLAEAIPQEKYTWRPAEGVRSIHEVLLHVASTNYTFPNMVGIRPPQGLDLQGLPSLSTEKAKIREALEAAFAHARQGVLAMSDAEVERETRPGWTVRRVLVFQLRHASEHLGQLIAYARENGITPPWTEAQQRRQAPAKQP